MQKNTYFFSIPRVLSEFDKIFSMHAIYLFPSAEVSTQCFWLTWKDIFVCSTGHMPETIYHIL